MDEVKKEKSGRRKKRGEERLLCQSTSDLIVDPLQQRIFFLLQEDRCDIIFLSTLHFMPHCTTFGVVNYNWCIHYFSSDFVFKVWICLASFLSTCALLESNKHMKSASSHVPNDHCCFLLVQLTALCSTGHPTCLFIDTRAHTSRHLHQARFLHYAKAAFFGIQKDPDSLSLLCLNTQEPYIMALHARLSLILFL